jgi:hypothetical protein
MKQFSLHTQLPIPAIKTQEGCGIVSNWDYKTNSGLNDIILG